MLEAHPRGSHHASRESRGGDQGDSCNGPPFSQLILILLTTTHPERKIAVFQTPSQEIQKDAERRLSHARTVAQSEPCRVTRLTEAPAAFSEIGVNRVVFP